MCLRCDQGRLTNRTKQLGPSTRQRRRRNWIEVFGVDQISSIAPVILSYIIASRVKEPVHQIMFSQPFSSWHALPSEMKLSIIDYLDSDNVVALSKVDQRTYHACVPALFKVCSQFDNNVLKSYLFYRPSDWGAMNLSNNFSKTSLDTTILILKIFSCAQKTNQPTAVRSYLVFGQTRSSPFYRLLHVSEGWSSK
jgi:hypothetical protein